MDVLLLSKKKKKHLSLEGLVMVYLYKCPICAFRAMDCTKECGSDNFISTAFLSVSINRPFGINYVTQNVLCTSS